MTPAEWVSCVIAALALAITVWNSTRSNDLKTEKRLTQMETKIDTIWGLVFRGGVSEAIVGGLFERNSPLQLNLGAVENSTLFDDIKKWYMDSNGSKWSDIELLVELENAFGAAMQQFCEASHFKVKPGGALATALYVCRPDAYIFAKLPEDERPIIPPRT
jgi:hypothetical protein